LYNAEKPNIGMLVLKDSPIRTGADLNGKTISSLAVRDLNAIAMYAWIDKTGGDSKTVKVIELPSSAVLAGLEEHRADAAAIIEPALTQLLTTGKARVLAHQFDAIGSRVEQTAFASTSPFVDANRDLMSRFAVAMHESEVYTNSHLPQTAELVASFAGITEDVVLHSVRVIDPEYVEAG